MKPLKDILYHYNKAAVQGFESGLVCRALEMVKKTLRARGNKPRAFEDYTMKELDQSWRMHMLSSHLKTALNDDLYFNHYFVGHVAREMGEVGFKDVDLISSFL